MLLVFEIDIYCSSEDTAPDDVEHPGMYSQLQTSHLLRSSIMLINQIGVRPLLKLKIDLRDVPQKHFIPRSSTVVGFNYWDIPAAVFMKMTSASLDFTTFVAGQECGRVEVQYGHGNLESQRHPKYTSSYCHYHGTMHSIAIDEGGEDIMG